MGSRKTLGHPLAQIVLAIVFVAFTASIDLSLATAGPASAAPVTPFTCSVGGTMTFEGAFSLAQGISTDGWATPHFTPLGVRVDGGYEDISYPAIGGAGCSGSGSAQFVTQGVVCNHKTPGLPASNPACAPSDKWGFNSWADVLGNVTPGSAMHRHPGATFADAIGAHLWSFQINGTSFTAESHAYSTTLVPAGSLCGPSEIGFKVANARLLEPHHDSQTLTVTLCLGAITGIGLNPGDNFYDASIDQIGVVQTATIDQATSTVQVG